MKLRHRCRTDLHVVDGEPQAGVKTTTTIYPMAHANEALADLKAGRFQGAAVLMPQSE